MSTGGARRPPLEVSADRWGTPERTERHEALEELTTAVRRLVEATVATGHDVGTLRELREEVDALAEKLESQLDDDPWKARASGSIDEPERMMGINPAIGAANPVAPRTDLVVRPGDPEVRGTVRFGLAHVGPPYRAHGGVIASTFDQVLGIATIAGGAPGMTARMTVTYRRATPIEQDVRIEATLEDAEGRTSRATGRMLDAEGNVTAEAEATFVQLKRQT